ncbi:MAG: ABC transporter permease [Myxococcota bacterium]
MKRSLIIARFELVSAVRRTSYLVMTFGLPVFFAAITGIPALLQGRAIEREVAREVAYGVIDPSELLFEGPDPEPVTLDTVTLFPVADATAARAYLVEGRLAGYFVLDGSYIEDGTIEVVVPANRPPLDVGAQAAEKLIQEALVHVILGAGVERPIRERVAERATFERRYLAPDGTLREVRIRGLDALARLVVPLILAMLLLMALMTTSGYLVQAISVEKENKVVEVLLSSAHPNEIMTGKLLGLGTAGLLQFFVWSAMVVVGGLSLADLLNDLAIALPWSAVLAAPVFFVLGYLFSGSLMLATGSLGNSVAENQKLTLAWGLLSLMPMMLLSTILQEPHGMTATVLTWLPFTSPLTIVLRLALDASGVPWWEVVGVGLALAGWIFVAIRFGARLFRVGLLLSGSWPGLREVLKQARVR